MPGSRMTIDDAEELEELEVGPCCACEKQGGPDVRNIVMLHQRGPRPGQGWGCVQCGLPPDGADYVLCDGCLEDGREPRFVCDGYPKNGRIPIEELSDEPFEHDMSKHPEETAWAG